MREVMPTSYSLLISLINGEKISVSFSNFEKATAIFDQFSTAIKHNVDMLLCTSGDNMVLIPHSIDIKAMQLQPVRESLPTPPTELQELQVKHMKLLIKVEQIRLEEMEREREFRGGE